MLHPLSHLSHIKQLFRGIEEELTFDIIGGRVVTNGILECGHSRAVASCGEEQTKGDVDLHQFSPE